MSETADRNARLQAAADEDARTGRLLDDGADHWTDRTADAAAERRAAARARDGWSIDDNLGAMERFTRSALGHVADGFGGIEELTRLHELAESIATVEATLVERLLADGDYSYADVARVYGISRQAVAKRFPGASARKPGGQPAELR